MKAPKPNKKLIWYNPNKAGQLHCDDCGYDLPEPQAFTRELIGFSCPKCGADMLTERDYKSTERMFALIDIINKAFGFLGKTRPPEGIKHIGVRIHNDTIEISQNSGPIR